MVVEDHDGCHTAGGDHEHDGREVSPCKVNTKMCNEKKKCYKKWLTDTAKINALGVGSTYWLAACILHRELCIKNTHFESVLGDQENSLQSKHGLRISAKSDAII